MKFDHEKQMTVMTLMSARAKTDAEIKLIHAQILEIVKGVQNADAELKLKHFEAYIDSLKAHSEMLGNSIETLATYGGKGGEDSDGTGVGGMGAGAGNAGASKPPAQVGGGAA
jgi:hypothetical protein